MDWLLAALRQEVARCGLRAACTCRYVLARAYIHASYLCAVIHTVAMMLEARGASYRYRYRRCE